MVDTRKNKEWQVTSGSVKSTRRGRIVCRKKLSCLFTQSKHKNDVTLSWVLGRSSVIMFTLIGSSDQKMFSLSRSLSLSVNVSYLKWRRQEWYHHCSHIIFIGCHSRRLFSVDTCHSDKWQNTSERPVQSDITRDTTGTYFMQTYFNEKWLT